tara:strand:- start:42 stop:2333 length:2292 start_codon:yes stop_codon:yes gene_type:complete
MGKKEITRDNHYVPIWYQKGFITGSRKKLHYLNLAPDEIQLPDGRTKHHRNLFESHPSQCFYQTDLYSTFFGSNINDEIEKKLFGDIDRLGAPAISAFSNDDVSTWHRHFQDLFLYLDAQKIRTPKGLDWIRSRYPKLDQNALMMEMQGVRTINCTIWSESVREIVSARNSGVKFIVTDHPVTIYNPACPPEHDLCRYPAEPSITLKASQTLFPLDQNHCLILTNLEYAQEPEATEPLEKRTFARQIRESLVRTDKFIKTRELSDQDVISINHVLKSRARRYVAAGQKEWLWPERDFEGNWKDVGELLLPPADGLWQFGGETFVGYEDGSVHYQDAFGRTKPKSDTLIKNIKESKIGANDSCGCGSGRKYKKCCRGKPEKQRTSWKSLSIRERNLGFFRGVNAILGTDPGKDWQDVRKELDEEKVKEIHELHGYLWPVDTDIFELLPKPDGMTRAVYSGFIDPRTAPFTVSNACLYFGEVLMQNPFVNPNQMKKEFSPVENPHSYLTQTLKHLMTFFQLAPLIESGHVNLFPDPSSLDPSLQNYAMGLAERRSKEIPLSERDLDIYRRIQEEDFHHTLCMLPKGSQENMLRQADPDASEEYIGYFINHLDRMRQDDPLVLLRDGVYDASQEAGQFSMFQTVPNFELLLFIAQATGAFVVTDSHHRWTEMCAASRRDAGIVSPRIPNTSNFAATSNMPLCEDVQAVSVMLDGGKLGAHRKWIDELYRQLRDQKTKPSDTELLAGLKDATVAVQRNFTDNHTKGM